MNQHQDQVEANIPEFGRMVFASLEEIIQFNPLVAAFSGSPLVVHEIESLNSGCLFRNSFITVPFPTPEEPDITNNLLTILPRFLPINFH